MKKIIYLLSLLVVLSLIGCSNGIDEDINLKRVNINMAEYNEDFVKYILATNFESFSDGDAVISITPTNQSETDYVVDYRYIHNGYMTKSGYTLTVRDGVVIYMRDNTIPLRTDATSVVPVVTEEIIQDAYALAKKELRDWNPDYEVYEQSGKKFYDVETDKYYYLVSTTYIASGDARGMRSTFYELN